jgi:electron transfer flavoprotein beta subunit
MGVNIIVCIKSIKSTASRGQRSFSDELNPYDRATLEVALRIREDLGGTITALSMGPETFATSLYEAMAIGVDRGILISDQALAGSDTLATSHVLAAAIRRLAFYDLVLFSAAAADSDTGQVGPQTAVALELHIITRVCSVEQGENSLLVERNYDGFLERYEVYFPAALTIHQSAIRPRETGFLRIQSVFEKGLECWNHTDLGLDREEVGEFGSRTRLFSLSQIKNTRGCTFMSGSGSSQADQLVKALLQLDMI